MAALKTKTNFGLPGRLGTVDVGASHGVILDSDAFALDCHIFKPLGPSATSVQQHSQQNASVAARREITAAASTARIQVPRLNFLDLSPT